MFSENRNWMLLPFPWTKALLSVGGVVSPATTVESLRTAGTVFLAGGEGGDVVAGGVLNGVGVIVGGGVGVDDDDGLALGDGEVKP